MPEVQPWVDVIEKSEVISFYKYYDYLQTLSIENKSGDESNDKKTNEQLEEESKSASTNLTTRWWRGWDICCTAWAWSLRTSSP